jgi:hypothetical protein
MDSLISRYHLHLIIDHFTIALLSMGEFADVIGNLIAACVALELLASKC